MYQAAQKKSWKRRKRRRVKSTSRTLPEPQEIYSIIHGTCLIFAKIKPRAQGAGREFAGHLAGTNFYVFCSTKYLTYAWCCGTLIMSSGNGCGLKYLFLRFCVWDACHPLRVWIETLFIFGGVSNRRKRCTAVHLFFFPFNFPRAAWQHWWRGL